VIKLTEVEPKGGRRLALRLSDGAAGVFDFALFIDANTPMTAPLRDPPFFARHYIKLGALAWPNGLDFSAEALYRRHAGCGKAGAWQAGGLNYDSALLQPADCCRRPNQIWSSTRILRTIRAHGMAR
jgi:hypothetical protein